MHYLIVPGINDSGPGHWQTLWQREWGEEASRIAPSSWDEPDLADWCRALDEAVHPHRDSGIVLVAHSLGTLAAAVWLQQDRQGVRGALLVAPPDPDGPNFPATAAGFAKLPGSRLRVPSLVISSENDPYGTPEAARGMAAAWGAGQVSVGELGHVNAESGLGAWERGRSLLSAFTAGLGVGVDGVEPGPGNP
jgi:predicted alpha/beta hydrolase family esterase